MKPNKATDKLNQEIPKNKLYAVVVGLVVLGIAFGAWFFYQTMQTANIVEDAGDAIEATR